MVLGEFIHLTWPLASACDQVFLEFVTPRSYLEFHCLHATTYEGYWSCLNLNSFHSKVQLYSCSSWCNHWYSAHSYDGDFSPYFSSTIRPSCFEASLRCFCFGSWSRHRMSAAPSCKIMASHSCSRCLSRSGTQLLPCRNSGFQQRPSWSSRCDHSCLDLDCFSSQQTGPFVYYKAKNDHFESCFIKFLEAL